MTTSDAVRTTTRCPTVLVVDDEPDQLGLMTTFLNREGCTVIAAASGGTQRRMSSLPGADLSSPRRSRSA